MKHKNKNELLLASIGCLSASLFPFLGSFDERRLWLAVLLSGTPLIALASGRLTGSLPRWLLSCGGPILALGLVSSLASELPAWGLLGVAQLMLMAVSACVIAAALERQAIADARLNALCFILPAGLWSFAALSIIYTAFATGLPLRYPEPLTIFANIRFLNQYQTWVIPFLTLALILPSPTSRVRPVFWYTLALAVGIFIWALYWRSMGRGTALATIIATVFAALAFGRPGLRHLKWTVVLSVSGLLLNALLFPGDGAVAGMGRLVSSDSPGRIALWQLALAQIGAHPWLGLGPLQFAALDNGIASHPHNAVTQWAVEWGLPAAVLLTGLLGRLLLEWLAFARRTIDPVGTRRAATDSDAMRVAITASLLAAGLHAMVSGVIVMPVSQYMLVLVTGIAGGLYLRSNPTLNEPHHPTGVATFMRASITAVVPVMCLYVMVFTVHDYRTRLTKARSEATSYIRNANQPRYWSDGTLVDISTTKPSK